MIDTPLSNPIIIMMGQTHNVNRQGEHDVKVPDGAVVAKSP